MKVLFFLAALAVVGLVFTGAIKLRKTPSSISIEIDRQAVRQDARKFIDESKEVIEDFREALDDDERERR